MSVIKHIEKQQQRKAVASGCMLMIVIVIIAIIIITLFVTHSTAIAHVLHHLHTTKPTVGS